MCVFRQIASRHIASMEAMWLKVMLSDTLYINVHLQYNVYLECALFTISVKIYRKSKTLYKTNLYEVKQCLLWALYSIIRVNNFILGIKKIYTLGVKDCLLLGKHCMHGVYHYTLGVNKCILWVNPNELRVKQCILRGTNWNWGVKHSKLWVNHYIMGVRHSKFEVKLCILEVKHCLLGENLFTGCKTLYTCTKTLYTGS